MDSVRVALERTLVVLLPEDAALQLDLSRAASGSTTMPGQHGRQQAADSSGSENGSDGGETYFVGAYNT